MHGDEKSDRPVVPMSPPNKAADAAAEAGEGSGLGKENAASTTRPGHSAGLSVPSALDRVRRVAKQDKKVRFTALLHHVDVDRLRAAYWGLNPKAATGVDGVTWQDYGQDLDANLRDLHARLRRGAYRARPSRRVYIPKADGRQRPLGVAALEDKLLQRAVVEVLNAIYETDFLGFSYGFRPGRSPHQALDALATGILRRKVGWVLDADIRGLYDAIDHGWLLQLLEFGRFAAERRTARGLGKPETFAFLGFTHICGKTKNGRFQLKRITEAKRMRAKLREVKTELMRRRHLPVPEQGRWLASVMRGHLAYYAVPGNGKAANSFRYVVIQHWHRALRRRSQRSSLTWKRMSRLAQRWLPPVRIIHPWPDARFHARIQAKSPVS